jgi:LytR cell envelope-related transcriptional attenuator
MRTSGSSRLARRRRSIAAFTGGGLVLVFVAGLALRAFQSRESSHAFAIPGEAGDRRLMVEVLNTTDVQGLARATTLELRRLGIDVVYFGSAGDSALESTAVVVRSAEPGARGQAERVARLLGLPETRVRVEPDSTRLVDLSVLVGRDLAARVDLHP